MNVVFAGGGTGGHLYPAIALADALGSRADVAFVGTADRLETSIVPAAGYQLYVVSARPLERKISLETVRTAWSNLRGTLQSLRLLGRLRPDVVIASGGYVCFPVVVAARVWRAAGRFRGGIALLETNAMPGLTNRLLAPLVDEVWGAFPDRGRFGKKFVRTGAPVRAGLLENRDRAAARARLGLSPGLPTLVAMGGSQGARAINDALIEVMRAKRFPDGWQLALVAGRQDYQRVAAALAGTARVAVFPYVSDPADAYASADLILARAGASTLAEVGARGLPSILVPYPYAAENHQAVNADCVRRTGAAVVVADSQLAAGALGAVLDEVCEPAQLAALRQAAAGARPADAVPVIVARIERLAARKGA